jgi:cytoplasmic iron level regulating protein YaaA (DUF328/UPF0246 family)
MISIISPAKKLNFSVVPIQRPVTEPVFKDEAFSLASLASELSITELSQLMSISNNLAKLNYNRFQEFKKQPITVETKPAALAFNGDTYSGLKAEIFTSEDFDFAQKNLRILSGLYGILRPLDSIQPYRLEMGSALHSPKGDNLYDYWSKDVTRRLGEELSKKDSHTIINLASIEYSKVISIGDLDAKIVTPQFLEEREGKFKNISFFSKKARGAMARFIIINRIEKPMDILAFDLENYKYSPNLSTDDKPTFTRQS